MRFSGKIGYAVTEETAPGVWTDNLVEKDAIGEYIRNSSRFNNSNNVNDNITFTSSISIIADPYALKNYTFIKYIKTFEGTAWKVQSIELQYPRLILTLGEIYNA